MSYQAVQALEMQQFGHLVVENETGRCLGGAGHNFYRIWAFPIYTPNGLTVIQEYPFDHPFHNGFFVGQYPVRFEGKEVNYWVAPPRRGDDPLYVALGRVDAASPLIEAYRHGVRFTFNSVWRDENEEPVLDEVRSINIYAIDDATVCEMKSCKKATYGDLEYPQTKMGGIGIRVEPRLLPALGGVVLADNERRGTSEIVHEQNSDYVAYEGSASGENRFGVCLMPLQPDVPGSWFMRDYGMALYNPTWPTSLSTPEGESWCIGLRVIAYDGALTAQRARRWRADLR
jgi:hypothetical protein